MARDAIEKRVRVVENLVDLSVVERGVEAAGKALGAAASAAAGLFCDRPQRRLDPRRREADRARELDVQQQELDDAARPKVGGVEAAVRLERRTRPQQAQPF